MIVKCVINKRASYNYQLHKFYEAGLSLQGWEASSIKRGSCNLANSYIEAKQGKAILHNLYIRPSDTVMFKDQITTKRSIALLLKRKEIFKLLDHLNKTKSGSIIPIKMYLIKNKWKLKLATATGKKVYDKRQTIKERDLRRIEQSQHKQR